VLSVSGRDLVEVHESLGDLGRGRPVATSTKRADVRDLSTVTERLFILRLTSVNKVQPSTAHEV